MSAHTTRISIQEEHIKVDPEQIDQLLATPATSEFRILTSGNTQEQLLIYKPSMQSWLATGSCLHFLLHPRMKTASQTCLVHSQVLLLEIILTPQELHGFLVLFGEVLRGGNLSVYVVCLSFVVHAAQVSADFHKQEEEPSCPDIRAR